MIDVENYLNSFFKGTKNPSLDAMHYFMKEYHNFQKEMKFIHIAGTNGKGSCTEMISNILINQGYIVGKFISPHLIRYNERISINQTEISNSALSDLIEELNPKINQYNKNHQMPITLFELETIMALLYFYRNHVDFVVLETGLGGLYDCTNIISNPLISLITSIGFDHMHILGNTLLEIAYQKFGIIKENSHTVFFEHSNEINKLLTEICSKKKNNFHLIKNNEIKNYHYDADFQYFDYKNLNHIAINLKGIKQIYNASLCIESMHILNTLGYTVSEENIRKGLSTVVHKGRMEIVNKNPLIIYDGAHNEPAIENLQKTIDMYYPNSKRLYIVSILNRKDYKKMIELLLQDTEATFILTSGNDENRYASMDDLYHTAIQYKMPNQKIYTKTFDSAIECIMQSQNDYINFIVGSFYTYGSAIQKIQEIRESYT